MNQPILTDGGRQLTVMFTGRRGLPGGDGDKGDKGDPGRSINGRGLWTPGTVYAPSDAVTADSSAMQGVQSLFVQRENIPESQSNTPPRDDVGRWMEVGPTDLSNVTGAIWTVTQLNHGFTKIGEPVGYSPTANRWVLANNKLGDEAAVAVVRDIFSADEVLLQGSGQISGLDPAVISPAGTPSFEAGRFYFVDSVRGFLTLAPTVGASTFGSNAMLLATGPTDGVVLQWQQTPNVVGRRIAGYTSYFYTAAAGQTVFSGADLDGNVLTYVVTPQTRVLVDGVDILSRGGFTAGDGLTVTLAAPLSGGQLVEVRVLTEPLAAIAPATSLVVDNISAGFDGVRAQFPITVGGGLAVAFGPDQNVIVYLDGNPQEPSVDYTLVPGLATDTDIAFTQPPRAGTRFWALAGVAVSNLSFLEVDTLIAGVGTIGDLNFLIGTGDQLTVDDLFVDSATISVATVTGLTVTTVAATNGTVSGAWGVGSLTAATTITGASGSVTGTWGASVLAATTNLTAPTGTISGAWNVGSLVSSGNISAPSGTVSGTLTVGTLAATTVNATTINATGTAEAATLRAATLRGPTAGGQIEAFDLTIDEGVF